MIYVVVMSGLEFHAYESGSRPALADALLCSWGIGLARASAPRSLSVLQAPYSDCQVKGTWNTAYRRASCRLRICRESPLTLHETKQPPLGSVGGAFPPALLSPRRQEWDDKGKALGVDLPSRGHPLPSETVVDLARRIVTRRAKTKVNENKLHRFH